MSQTQAADDELLASWQLFLLGRGGPFAAVTG
jgi:hypothetical protein